MYNDGLHDPGEAVGTETGTVGDDSDAIDPDLRVVIDAWPVLPEATRRDMLGLVWAAAQPEA